jgi:hypothetical protein
MTRRRTTGDQIAHDMGVFDVAFARREEDELRNRRECVCSFGDPVCRWCPERNAPSAKEAA